MGLSRPHCLVVVQFFFSSVGAELIGAWDFLKRVQGSDVKVALGKELTR